MKGVHCFAVEIQLGRISIEFQRKFTDKDGTIALPSRARSRTSGAADSGSKSKRWVNDKEEKMVKDEDAQPTDEETLVFKTLAAALASAATNIEAIKGYAGCSDAIRTAISSPSLEAEDAVWRRLTPAIAQLMMPSRKPSTSLHLPTPLPITSNSIKQQQKELRTFYFSQINCQNDLAYYRRSLQKVRLVGGGTGGGGPRQLISDDLANSMSMFFAQPAPMLSDKYGAFSKESKIDIRAYVRLIKGNGGPLTSTLMNGLRFSTTHLNDENTPTNIKDYVNDG
ncbi:Protein fam49a [Physocladia obscura]|uniref:Protein fam49a n=1 Tax=Physocladia obscura TaxID=109957 RepID=A0AAD5XFY2_9FUNG|nr:Protein fam49a [Physocladia obscura]